MGNLKQHIARKHPRSLSAFVKVNKKSEAQIPIDSLQRFISQLQLDTLLVRWVVVGLLSWSKVGIN